MSRKSNCDFSMLLRTEVSLSLPPFSLSLLFSAKSIPIWDYTQSLSGTWLESIWKEHPFSFTLPIGSPQHPPCVFSSWLREPFFMGLSLLFWHASQPSPMQKDTAVYRLQCQHFQLYCFLMQKFPLINIHLK